MKDTVKNSRIKVPFFVPNISKDDKKEILNALDKPILTDGPKLREFEKVFAEFVGTKYAIVVSNATSALFLSLKALTATLSKNLLFFLFVFRLAIFLLKDDEA